MVKRESIEERVQMDWLIKLFSRLIGEEFTGSIRINFHKGAISRKVEKVSFISEK